MPTIHTTRYSKVVTAFIDQYPQAEIRLDKRQPEGGLASWCTNRALRRAIDFSLRQGKIELLGFHDGPTNMWAAFEALPLIEKLAAQKLLRYTVEPPTRPSLLSRLLGCHRAT
jgi:hypothetical protein